MNARFVGGILLIVGTSIGAGMFALPIVNAATGFWQSSLLLILCWLLMTTSAFYILEVSLCMPRGKHMVSMAQSTLGTTGSVVAWISYLFLLYTLLCAYISGGADVLGGLLHYLDIHAPWWLLVALFTLVFGSIVYRGIYQVDIVNRGLMFAKLGVFALLVILVLPYTHTNNLQGGGFRYAASTFMVLITAFGFAIIVPNLRDYFDDDIPTLKRVIFIGSLIPLFCYLIWDAVIIGSLPTHGELGLIALTHSKHSTTSLASMLSHVVHNAFIVSFFNFFSAVSMLTAFLGVSLCLFSFLSDGLRLEQRGKSGGLLFLLAFLPPILIVARYPGIYIHALAYAGYFCVVLLMLLPALMSYFGRKRLNPRFKVPGKSVLQFVVVFLALVLLALTFYNDFF